MAIRIGIVGLGKIARDQHVPVIEASPDFTLAAVASRSGGLPDLPYYSDIGDMLAGDDGLDAVALCQPPQVRYDAARAAILAGKHVFLEKPPGATLSEVKSLADLAQAHGVTLFASWHSRYASGVAAAKAWLAERTIRSVAVEWKEDVRVWHPGQAWIWEPGGLGVFDPGINAMSIVTHIMPRPFFLLDGTLSFPENRGAPIAADLTFRDDSGVPITAAFDWRQTGPQTWDISVDTVDGALVLSKGGSVLTIAGELQETAPEAEYRGLYDRFAGLVARGESDVDVSPLRHVADAYLRGARVVVEPFED
ncbi:Gfo/Idh/MocA family protein [Sphingomonas prati]|uniref:D-galactose 1-dehydrogenase n=1 Tax=Sphingomonas prati TaxID=1843237 RepID=A0A7W9F1C4_9SPHN|nr:Gfo/Idh/MocA family oxidoreductase [Sphingomonas prati]MBB5727624.1 D-galactose 1-dehydrogenase [Sphingomonas prati]GGE79455.1 dehydrogenase [Sphingomonas prati]